MKTRQIVLGSLLATTLSAGQAVAGTYAPGRIDLELEPGDKATVTYTFSDNAWLVMPFYSMSGDATLQGWMGVSAAYGFGGKGDATVTLNVPQDAESGSYEVTLFGYGRTRDAGLPFNVTVGGGGCSELVEFVPGSENEIKLWAPNNASHPVELSGGIKVPDGCTIVSKSYSVADEYNPQDIDTGDLVITGDNEGYLATPSIEASRRGNDKDGRTYTVEIKIETEKGEATRTRTIVVQHDRRDKGAK